MVKILDCEKCKKRQQAMRKGFKTLANNLRRRPAKPGKPLAEKQNVRL